MTKLNLPEYDFRIQNTDKGVQIFDSIRKKYLTLTPEEWVRQNFIQYLIQEKKYPSSLIAVEAGMKYNKLQKRCDIAIYDKGGVIWMLVECKSTDITLSQKTFDQLATYNKAINKPAKYLAITNGLKHFCCENSANVQNGMKEGSQEYVFLKDFPSFPL